MYIQKASLLLRGVLFVVACALWNHSALGADAATNTEQIKQGFTNRLKLMRNIHVSYESKISYTPPNSEPIDPRAIGETGLAGKPIAGLLESRCSFSMFDTQHFAYERLLSDDTARRLATDGFSCGRYERVQYLDGVAARVALYLDGKISRLVVEHYPLPADSIVDVAFGLRCLGSDAWLSDDTIAKSTIRAQRDATDICVENADGVESVFTVDPGNGYVVTEYQVVSNGKVFVDYKCDDFKVTDSITVPTRITGGGYYYQGNARHTTVDINLSITNCRFGNNTDETFNTNVMEVPQIGKLPVSVPSKRPTIYMPTTRPGVDGTAVPTVEGLGAEGGVPLEGDGALTYENVFDFGDAVAGTRIRHEFVISNHGGKVMQIAGTSVDCGCTAVQLQSHNILPGHDLHLAVTVDVGGAEDHITKRLIVLFAGQEMAPIEMYVRGKVVSAAKSR